MRTIDQMVQQEIMCCMSSLVATLANGYGSVSPEDSFGESIDGGLASLTEQASELSSPILDYEEAARQRGWVPSPHESACFIKRLADNDEAGPADSWEQACAWDGIDPYDREVFEHWAVTTWLAEKLMEAGERVDTDFGGLNVWARTTTGQSISMDGVIQKIYAKMMEPVA